jgi:hypothetical protein
VDTDTKPFSDLGRWVSAINNLLDRSDLKFFRVALPTHDFSFAQNYGSGGSTMFVAIHFMPREH